MMKKIASLLCVLLLLTGVAMAEEISSTITLSVLDMDGNALSGAIVSVYDNERKVVEEYVSGEEPYVMENLEEGMYTVKAVDPADGYTAAESFYADADQEIQLVIRKLQVGTKAVVGNMTRMSGAFFTDMWGNNTSDVDVRALVHGLSTVSWTLDRQYDFDPTVIAKVDAVQDLNGNKIYTFELNKNLKYSDGTPITAADYVFSVLMQSAPETAAIGAQALSYAQLLGHADYLTGEEEIFTGVRLLDTYEFSLTVSRKYLPYFYELMFVNVTPYPISVIAPGCEVKDNGKGTYIEGPFTVELLEKTVLDPQTGYLTNPSVSSGPYTLTGYDAQTGTATFTVNKHYAGNYQGIKPVIESLELREIKYEDALTQLADGEIDIINKATEGDFIEAGVKGFGEGAHSATNYMRTGYGFLAYACEESATQSVKVRQAMAMAFDRESMIDDFLKSFGLPVYSYYGLGQWVVQPYASTIQDEVTVYPLDLEAAASLLEEDGWVYDAQGNAFAEGEGAVRYRKNAEGELEPLAIRFAQLKDNEAAQWVVDHYAPVLVSLGFSFEATEVTFDELLTHYYRQTERTYNLMYLATNFAMVFDPYYTFHTDEAYQGALNTSGIQDENLMKLAERLRETKPGDEEKYAERWLELMKEYSEVLPTLPIYSNIYYDFFANDLMDYEPNAHWSWPSAIVYAYFAE